MRPCVCSAPVPAPERDRPAEGCQLAVLDYGRKSNYVERRRQARASSRDVEQTRALLPDVSARRRCSTPRLDALSGFRLLSPPPHRRQRLLTRPHFVQGLTLVQPAVLHHIANLLRVVDILK